MRKYVIERLVTDGRNEWLEKRVFIGYSEAEVKVLYKEWLAKEGLELV